MSELLSFDLGHARECQVFLVPEITAKANAFRVGDLLVSRLPFADWTMLERSQYTDDLTDVYGSRRPPFFCIFAEPAVLMYEGVEEAVTQTRIARMRLLTLALRLVSDLPVPVVSGTDFVSYRRRGATMWHQVSHAGRAAYEYHARLEVDDLITDWSRVYDLLSFFNRFRHLERLSLAADLYFQSAAIFLRGHSREVLLHAAIEALCGKAIGRLSEVRWGDADVARVTRSRRSRRNALAHGENIESFDHEVPLRRLTGWLVLESLRQEIIHPKGDTSLDAGLIRSLRTADSFGVTRLRDLPTDEEALLYGPLQRNTRGRIRDRQSGPRE